MILVLIGEGTIQIAGYGTNHIQLNIVRVQNGRTHSVPVPTEQEQPYSMRVVDDCMQKVYTYLVIPRVTPTYLPFVSSLEDGLFKLREAVNSLLSSLGKKLHRRR